VVIGVLSVGSGVPRTFTQREIDLLQRFADQAALTISNVRTQETLVRRRARLQILRHRPRHHHRDRAGRDRGGGARPPPALGVPARS
jgi:GAF domain-containing protein